jgi:hypothetical protein
MKVPRREFIRLAATAAAVPVLSHLAIAQTYPVRPVRLIVAFVPGGATDTLARQISNDLKEALAKPLWWKIGRAPTVTSPGITSRPRSRMATRSSLLKTRSP